MASVFTKQYLAILQSITPHTIADIITNYVQVCDSGKCDSCAKCTIIGCEIVHGLEECDCGKTMCEECTGICYACQKGICQFCQKLCSRCNAISHLSCFTTCTFCSDVMCKACRDTCAHYPCYTLCCLQCQQYCLYCSTSMCPVCVLTCDYCHQPLCETCGTRCRHCGDNYCFDCDWILTPLRTCDHCDVRACSLKCFNIHKCKANQQRPKRKRKRR